MPWKKNAAGQLEVDAKGNPVHIRPDNTEHAMDGDETFATIGRIMGEARTNREAAETAQGKLKSFDAITDPAAALAALETVKAFNGKQALTAEELDTIRKDVAKASDAKHAPLKDENVKLKGRIETGFRSAAFGNSEFVKGKLSIPADFAEAKFGSHFAFDLDGKVIVKGHDGQELMSAANPGNKATFDEGLEILVNGYAGKASILKGAGQSGGGSGGGSGGNPGNGGKPTYTRKQFESIADPIEQARVASTAVIVD